VTLTQRQLAIYEFVLMSDGRYLAGPDLRVARVLEQHGLVAIEDDGRIAGVGERWWVTRKPLSIPFDHLNDPPGVTSWMFLHGTGDAQ